MPTTSVLLSFALASALLAVTPGPSVLLLLAVGADDGRRAASWTAVGLAVGTALWCAVAAAGLGATLAARPGLLRTVTLGGAAYLLWLAVQRLRTADEPARAEAGAVRASAAAPLRTGAVVNLLNPSIAVFLVAITPPFLVPDGPPAWQQLAWLGAVLTGVSTVVNLGWGTLGASVGRRATTWAGARRSALVVAATYALLAVAVAVSVLR